MILSQRDTNAILCGCAAILLAILLPAPVQVHAQDRTNPPDAVAPDNTARNAAHQRTADQQPNNAADLNTTKQIRQAVISDGSLSTYAHNVKIITTNGVVTLKGPVHSQAEKASIAEKADAVAGKRNVRNQLSIEPSN